MDPDTGEVLSGYLFVAVLPFSGYAFAFSCSDMKQDNWIQAHISLFEFLGGVPLLVVSDNLRTGVKKHTRSTLVLNRNYEDLANHYHTVILPARVKKPKDKVSVENTVKRLTTHVVARMRNYTFFSLEEYNQRSPSIQYQTLSKKDWLLSDSIRRHRKTGAPTTTDLSL